MRAAIDIGTNSVLLLIATIDTGALTAVRQEARITRLGEGLARASKLSPAAIERTMSVLKDYRDLCREHGAEAVTALGTAAMRRATNASELIDRAREELGLAIRVIGEECEAQLTWRGSASSFGNDIIVMDIGGGSTEFIAPSLERPGTLCARSLDLGVVTITERFLHADPSTDDEVAAVRSFVRARLEEKLDRAVYARASLTFVATAGTPTTLAAMKAGIEPYDPKRVHGATLSMEDVDSLTVAIKGRTIKERRAMKGLQRGREDVALAGALLMSEAMSVLGHPRATVSDRGVRWGALLEQLAPADGT